MAVEAYSPGESIFEFHDHFGSLALEINDEIEQEAKLADQEGRRGPQPVELPEHPAWETVEPLKAKHIDTKRMKQSKIPRRSRRFPHGGRA